MPSTAFYMMQSTFFPLLVICVLLLVQIFEYILQMPQVQYYCDFIFEDHWPDFVDSSVSRNEFQGINFVVCM